LQHFDGSANSGAIAEFGPAADVGSEPVAKVCLSF
jgi:hypothetical protein